MKQISTFFLLFCLSFFSFGQNQNEAKIQQQDLETFLSYIPKAFLKEHGFNSTLEFKKAETASQYQIMSLNENGSLTPTGFYNVPVIVNSEYRALLTVGEFDGEFGIQGVGSTLMAKNIQSVEQNQRLHANMKYLLVNDYKNKATYLSFLNANQKTSSAQLIPLESAKTFLQNQTNNVNSSYSLDELVKINSKVNYN